MFEHTFAPLLELAFRSVPGLERLFAQLRGAAVVVIRGGNGCHVASADAACLESEWDSRRQVACVVARVLVGCQVRDIEICRLSIPTILAPSAVASFVNHVTSTTTAIFIAWRRRLNTAHTFTLV
jgi:hypothetical protein